MATTIQSTALDFNNIKNNLKTYLQRQSEFADYDFEASGLSNILDVLAYNTHINALVANMTLNESFLGTAQLRSSIASLANGLGYVPFSRTSARATIRCSVNLSQVINRPGAISLPRYTKFTSTVDDESYTFQTLEEYVAQDNGSGIYQFRGANGELDLEIYEGVLTTKTFLVGETANTDVYIIPDENVDTTTATVNVFESPGSTTFTSYGDILKATSINEQSSVYILKEVPNGYFQLSFGSNNILGNQPQAGNSIVVDYLSTNGPIANRATGFVPVSPITVNSGNYSLFVTTVSRSSGGREKEEIESIRRAAPFQYASQNRMVTPEDYSSIIKRTYPTFIESLKSWGGEDNPEPKFGTVFSSIRFVEDITPAQIAAIKRGITALVEDLAIVSFAIEFVDPQDTYIENDVYYQVNPNLTPVSLQTLNQRIKTAIEEYYANNTGDFDQSFRRSNLLTIIDAISPAVLSSRANVRIQQRITPIVNTSNTLTLTYPAAIRTAANETEEIVTSSYFYINNISNIEKLVKIKNRGSTLQIYEPSSGTVIVDNIGSINYANGTLRIVDINPTRIPSGSQIKISVVPANESFVTPDRNNIIKYDNENSLITPVVVSDVN
jgi:hypothetical protein